MSSSKRGAYTTGEAAKYIGVSQSTIINYIEKGLLKPDYILPAIGAKKGRRMFYQDTLDSFKEKMIVKET